MSLVETAFSPIPADGVTGNILADDGVGLRYAVWRGSGERRGTVCILQGRAECIEKYFEVVSELRGRGFAVAAVDWRGQGGSERLLRSARKGHVERFADYQRDLIALLEQIVVPDCPPPYFVLAHSMGGLVALHAARRQVQHIARMVLLSPMLRLMGIMPRSLLAAAAAGALRRIGFGDLRLPGREAMAVDRRLFLGNRNTSDPVRYERFADLLRQAPHLAVGAATLGWFATARRAMADVQRDGFGAAIAIPTLLLTAGADEVVDNAVADRLAKALRAGASLEIPGARHEILFERDSIRSLFWAAFDAFIPGSAPP
ncbi:MAG: alpha/beta hydrolase [Bauldia sp.]